MGSIMVCFQCPVLGDIYSPEVGKETPFPYNTWWLELLTGRVSEFPSARWAPKGKQMQKILSLFTPKQADVFARSKEEGKMEIFEFVASNKKPLQTLTCGLKDTFSPLGNLPSSLYLVYFQQFQKTKYAIFYIWVNACTFSIRSLHAVCTQWEP